jgi:hypothetical protein
LQVYPAVACWFECRRSDDAQHADRRAGTSLPVVDAALADRAPVVVVTMRRGSRSSMADRIDGKTVVGDDLGPRPRRGADEGPLDVVGEPVANGLVLPLASFAR